MEFKPKTEQALEEWMGAYSSDSQHDEDETRKFYCFVCQYVQDHGYRMNQRAIMEAIKKGFDDRVALESNKSSVFQLVLVQRVRYLIF
jgi:hypothetical protein